MKDNGSIYTAQQYLYLKRSTDKPRGKAVQSLEFHFMPMIVNTLEHGAMLRYQLGSNSIAMVYNATKKMFQCQYHKLLI